MITDRQSRFRERYLAQISPWYHGLMHIGVMYGAGLLALWWCIGQLQHPSWEWCLIIPIAIAGNFAEWAMHLHIMHRLKDVFALRAIYDRHTRQHHQYFTDNDFTISSIKEFRIVFFPWRVLLVLSLASAVLGWGMALLLGPDAGYMVPITLIGHYMLYESFHFFCHVPENAFVRHCPIINSVRRHHSVHHNMGVMMHINMNLTFPLADWAMGTSDLNRSLLGHVFNGYQKEFQKPELTSLIEKFQRPQIEAERVTLEGPVLDDEDLHALTSAGGIRI